MLLTIDFVGPFPTGENLLIIIDDFSRFPEVDIIHSASQSDKGPPFNSSKFSSFAHRAEFKHRKIMPLWPEANDEAERFVQTLDKFIHACVAEGFPNFLRQYQATPPSSKLQFRVKVKLKIYVDNFMHLYALLFC